MNKLMAAVALAATLASVASAPAQVYPSRPIALVVPLAPGGSTDVIGRIMAEGMRAALGQPVIVENTAGAAGTIDITLDTPAISMSQVRGGNIKAYAVTAKNRIAIAPEIPTTDEAGLPGFYFSFWHALWVPKGTPKDIVAKLNGAAASALAKPGTRQKLVDLAQEMFPREQRTPEALAALHQAES